MTGFTWKPFDPASDTPHTDPIAVATACATIQWSEEQCNDPDWFIPSLNHLHDPMKMAGMSEAIARLHVALEQNQRIRIITDYDVDGTTSSLILQATLRILKADVALDYHIPDRFNEGYGFSTQAAQKAVRDGIDLIITADIGIRDQAAVDEAQKGQVDVLICDHHLPSGVDVPKGAFVLCPPQKACSYPNPHLAACGVSLKLAQALLASHRSVDGIFQSMLKLAAIGTVADMVSLTSQENRAIVALGLRALNEDKHNAGLIALLDIAKAKRGQIDEGTIGYQIGPRINAAGRMSDAKIIVEMLNCRDPTQANTFAKRIDDFNKERRAVQENLVQQALTQLGSPPPSCVIVSGLESEGWHRGVVGIVAARLMRKTHRPAAVISIQADQAVGSMRSIDGVHCVELLNQAEDLLIKYGGHPKAAGFTVPIELLETFKQRMNQAVDEIATQESMMAVHLYTLVLHPEALVLALTSEINRLGPFGMGNLRPQFLLKNVKAARVRTLSEGKHLKFQIESTGQPVDVIWWNEGSRLSEFERGTVDLLGALSVNSWQGRQSLQFLLTDARQSES